MREILYGRNAVYESLRAGRRRTHRLILAESVHNKDVIGQIVLLAERAGLRAERVDRRKLDSLGDVNHQGVALEVDPFPYSSIDDAFARAEARDEPALLLLLDLLQDPQNVGSLLRTAEAVGVHGIVIQRRRAVGITPAVVRASSGAAEHTLVAQVTNLVEAIGQLKERDVWVAGLEAVSEAQLYHQADLTGPLALVVGSEGQGLRRLVRERCDFLLQIPIRGQVTSLNAAVAGSVVLYEAIRHRQKEMAR